MNELSDSIAWPARDPDWVSKVLLTGLIGIIPIVGWLNLYGWMLATVENLRAGRAELPPAGFDYVGRGVNLFVVHLVYGVVAAAIFWVLFALGIGISRASSGWAIALGVLLILLGYAFVLAVGIGFYFFMPAIVIATDRGGIGGGLNVRRVYGMVSRNFGSALQHGLFALIANLMGGIGSIVCFVGVIFTAPYGYATLAGVVRHYEQTAGPQAAPVG